MVGQPDGGRIAGALVAALALATLSGCVDGTYFVPCDAKVTRSPDRDTVSFCGATIAVGLTQGTLQILNAADGAIDWSTISLRVEEAGVRVGFHEPPGPSGGRLVASGSWFQVVSEPTPIVHADLVYLCHTVDVSRPTKAALRHEAVQHEFTFADLPGCETKVTPPDITCPPRRPFGPVLVDASAGGGLWWSPQNYKNPNASKPHQGLKAADAIRKRGTEVTELTSTDPVTPELLDCYPFVIAIARFDANLEQPEYSDAELDAYDAYVRGGGSLLLAADHGNEADLLAERLGIVLLGRTSTQTDIVFQPHELTKGMTTGTIAAGTCALRMPSGGVALATLAEDEICDTDGDKQFEAGEPRQTTAIGLFTLGTGEVLFFTDIEYVLNPDTPFFNAFVNHFLV